MFKRIVLTGLALLVILVTVASPVAAKGGGNGWYMSVPYFYGDKVACNEATGAIIMPVAVDFVMPVGAKTATLALFVDGEFVREIVVTESGTWETSAWSDNRSFTVKFTLSFKGVVKSSEKLFTNTCPFPAL